MIHVGDASCLYEIISEGPLAESTRAALGRFDEWAAPALIDAEVMGLIRRDVLQGHLHESRAAVAVAELTDWPGERSMHRLLGERVWELRDNVRTWDAYYVALAEVLGASLATLDRRLVRARGPECAFIVPGPLAG